MSIASAFVNSVVTVRDATPSVTSHAVGTAPGTHTVWNTAAAMLTSSYVVSGHDSVARNPAVPSRSTVAVPVATPDANRYSVWSSLPSVRSKAWFTAVPRISRSATS